MSERAPRELPSTTSDADARPTHTGSGPVGEGERAPPPAAAHATRNRLQTDRLSEEEQARLALVVERFEQAWGRPCRVGTRGP